MLPAEHFIFTWEPGMARTPTVPPGRRASTARVQQEKGSWRIAVRVWWWWPDTPSRAGPSLERAGAGPAGRSG